MYLEARKYIPGYEHCKPEDKKRYNALLKVMGLKSLSKSATYGEISFNVAYWRKANQIHNWFVREVQAGKDDCDRYPVSRETLENLVKTCKEGLANRDSAAKSLPTSDGFFFGSTSYDEYYFDGLKDTVDQIQSILDNKALDSWYFEYRASW